MAVQGNDPAALRVAAKALRMTAMGFAGLATTYAALAAAAALHAPCLCGGYMAQAKKYGDLATLTYGLASAAEMKANQQEAASLSSGFTPPDAGLTSTTLPDTAHQTDESFFGNDPWVDPRDPDGTGAGARGDLMAGIGGSTWADGAPGAGQAGLDIAGFEPGAFGDGTAGDPNDSDNRLEPLEALGLAGRAGVAGIALAGVIGAGAAAAGVFGASRRANQQEGEDDEDDETAESESPVGAAARRTEA